MLVAGRERQYLHVFFNRRTANATAISDADLDACASAYPAPGAMRAGFEAYRAFGQDADDHQATLTRNGKLGMPVLAAGGAMSSAGPYVEQMMNEAAENVTGIRIPGAAHFIPEENPEASASAVLDFTSSPASN